MTDLEMRVEALIECVGRERYERVLRVLQAQCGMDGKTDMQNVCEDILLELGVSPGCRGYRCICACLEIMFERRPAQGYSLLTKDIYPEAARRIGCSATSVEKNICRAIERAWEDCPDGLKLAYFGTVVATRRPSVGTFLKTVALAAQRRMKRGKCVIDIEEE